MFPTIFPLIIMFLTVMFATAGVSTHDTGETTLLHIKLLFNGDMRKSEDSGNLNDIQIKLLFGK